MADEQYVRVAVPTFWNGMRVPPGQLLELDEETAARWLKHGIAKASTASAYQHQQEAAADLAAEQEEEEQPDAQLISRDDAPGSSPRRR